MTQANPQIRYVDQGGRLTLDGLALLQSLEKRVAAAEAKLAAIAALSDPSGGATIDAEARAAIAQILDAAG